ncbi:MAG: hypothetical protein ACFFAU_08145 [Candidatus Hodarchaeota archaeon]
MANYAIGVIKRGLYERVPFVVQKFVRSALYIPNRMDIIANPAYYHQYTVIKRVIRLLILFSLNFLSTIRTDIPIKA